MYNILTSFYIITASFLAIIVVMLVALLVKHKSIGRSPALRALRNFVICFLLIVGVYYVTIILGSYGGVFQRNTLGRIADFSFCILLEYCWFAFIRAHLAEADFIHHRFDIAANAVIAVFWALSLVNCSLLINNEYCASAGTERTLSLCIETGNDIVLCVLNIAYLVFVIKSGIQKQTGNFIIIVTALITVTQVFNGVVTDLLIAGRLMFSVETFYYDPTFLFMIAAALCTLIYIFRYNFSPIYFASNRESASAENVSEETVLEILASENRLTEREHEIMKLIYEGNSYEETARQLYISKYTVKNHVHNIYEKLGVSNKSELINMVRTLKNEHLQK